MVNSSNFILNFGPQHPAAHGVLRLLLELDGERIISADPHIGFLHRGTEKLIEVKTYFQSIPYFDRLDYVSMLTQEHAFILTAETLLNLKVSKYALVVRTMFDEITRLLNHIMCITTHALDVGALTPFLWGFEERENLLQFYELISGARMHAAYYRIGGISTPLPDVFFEIVYKFLIRYNWYINIIEDLLSKNPIWLSRLTGIGIITKKDIFNFSFSGPLARGSGIPWDLRQTQPYAFYKDIEFVTPLSFRGDSYSRYLIRLSEMKESLNIINKCVSLLENFGFLKNPLFGGSPKSLIKFSMEELIFDFKEKSNGLKIPAGTAYVSIEAPKGETGVFLVSDNSSKPYRCKIRSPGFFHLQGLDQISKNLLIADVVTNIGSLDIVFGEVDR